MEITVFTDGSFRKNSKGDTKAGYGVYFPNGEFENISEPFTLEPKTNQRAELYAIYTALTLVSESRINFRRLNIYTDSMYSLKALTEWNVMWEANNWISTAKKPIKNLDIIKPILDIMKQYKGMINIVHVKAHTGFTDLLSQGNEYADRLATSGGDKEIDKETVSKETKVKENKRATRKKKSKVMELNMDYSKIQILKIGGKTNIVIKD